MEGYFDNVIFNRIVKNFMVQTGDPTGSGFGMQGSASHASGPYARL
jgi:cyclophilin family peptidyl-prolyl cis-trans isomerase